MPMKTKWILLFFLIGFPIGVYLFLQGFGENKFAIPVLHQHGADEPVTDCEVSSNFQYYAPILVDSTAYESSEIVVYGLVLADVDENYWINVQSYFNSLEGETGVKVVFLITKEVNDAVSNTGFVNYATYVANDELLAKTKCALLVQDVVNTPIFVMCDRERRIRGYYDLSDLEELDRLITETRILRKEQND